MEINVKRTEDGRTVLEVVALEEEFRRLSFLDIYRGRKLEKIKEMG